MHDHVALQPVDYLVIGHITQDLTRDGPRLGGTATYSALTARALGLRVGVVTSANKSTSLKTFDGIQIISIPSKHTTTFENIYIAKTDEHKSFIIKPHIFPLILFQKFGEAHPSFIWGRWRRN